jgi:glycine/D-amino acid oxidase-like deaminating enzyme
MLVSRTIRDEPAGFNFDWEAAAFQSVVAPRLRHYLPTCGEPQPQRGWAGHYAVTPDENTYFGTAPRISSCVYGYGL